jgi:hypothetical protein
MMSRVRRFRSRLAGVFLAVLFPAANLALPAADVLLDHRLGESSQPGRTHLETQSGCREHTDHCPLAVILGAGRIKATVDLPAPSAHNVRAPGVAFTPAPLSAAHRAPAHRSRAPPRLA